MEGMARYTFGDKMRMSLWTVLVRVVFVAAVLGASLIPGVTVVGALLLVTLLLVMLTLLQIWVPPAPQRRRVSGPPGRPSGDRFPRRPLPFRPSLAAEERIPRT